MSEQLTTKDYEYLHKQSNQILAQIEQVELGSYKTKFELISQYVEIERKLLEGGKLELHDKRDFASYISRKLTDRNVTFARSGQSFYVLFREDEKRGNELRQNIEEISSDFTKLDNPVESPRKVIKQDIEDEYTQTLEYATVILEQARDICNDIIVKYKGVTVIKDGVETQVNFREEVKKGIGDLAQFKDELKEFNASLEHIAQNNDLRNKARDWKKIKALLLEKVEYNIAKVAQLIHISPKHMSANIMKNEQEDLMQKARWFDVIDVKCSCGKENTLDIGDWFNKQVERMNLSLPFKKPQITHVVKS